MATPMTDYLRRIWRRLVPGTVQILNYLGGPSNGAVLDVASRAEEVDVSATKPDDNDYHVVWRWTGAPLSGVTLERRADYAITIRVEKGAPRGLGYIQCVCTRSSDGAVFESRPYFIRIT